MTKSVIKRVVLIGAECTGKTTLARALSKKLDEPYSTEYVRHHVDQLDRPLDARDLDPIARGQIRFEDEAAATAHQYVFHDTNLLSSILYAEHYFDTHIDWADKCFSERKYDYYFLCEPDFPWEADPGQRESPEVRSNLQTLFETFLNRYRIPFIRLNGPIEERIATVIKTIGVDR